jgi:hypothetical protein
MNKYWSIPHTHYVIIEDTNDLNFWGNLLEKYYTTHTLKLITRNVYPSVYCERYEKLSFRENPGYYEQMLLKLKIANLLKTTHYLVLDSKNYFYNHIDYECKLIEGGGQRFHRSDNILKSWLSFADEFSLYINKPIPEYVVFPCTPFILNTDKVKKLLALNFECFFLEYFQRHNGVSEFIAYDFFAECYNENYGQCSTDQFNNIISSFLRQYVSVPAEVSIFKNNLRYIDQEIIERALQSIDVNDYPPQCQ